MRKDYKVLLKDWGKCWKSGGPWKKNEKTGLTLQGSDLQTARWLLSKLREQLRTLAHTCYPNTQEAEAGGQLSLRLAWANRMRQCLRKTKANIRGEIAHCIFKLNYFSAIFIYQAGIHRTNVLWTAVTNDLCCELSLRVNGALIYTVTEHAQYYLPDHFGLQFKLLLIGWTDGRMDG